MKDCNNCNCSLAERHECLLKQANELLIRNYPLNPSEHELDDADRPFYIIEDTEDLGETTWDSLTLPFRERVDYHEKEGTFKDCGMHYDSYHGWIGDDA